MKDKFDGYVIISDLDGTLLDNNKNISRENLEAINYFTENGGKFSVATGRVIEATEGYLSNRKLYVFKDSGHSYRSATQMLDIIYDVKDEIFSMD